MNEDQCPSPMAGAQAAPEVIEACRVEPQAPPTDAGRHDAIIKRVSNGFIVKVGCKTLVARKWDTVAEGLGKYWKDPGAAEKEYCDAN